MLVYVQVQPENSSQNHSTGELISTKPGVEGVDFAEHSHTLREGNV